MDFTRATEVTDEVSAAVDDAFEYHPWTPEMVSSGKHVLAVLADAVRVIIAHVPPGPDRTVAIRKIREARMDAYSAITGRRAGTLIRLTPARWSARNSLHDLGAQLTRQNRTL